MYLATCPSKRATSAVTASWQARSSSRISSGSSRAESAVEPTRSTNITVSWRRSAPTAGSGASPGGAAPARRAAIASSSRRRWPTDVMPMSLRSSAVSLASRSASTSLSRNACSYWPKSSPWSQAPTSTPVPRSGSLATVGAVYPKPCRTDTTVRSASVTMEDALVLPGSSPIAGKTVRVAFDGGRLTSDAGVLALAEVERRLGIAERLARCLTDPRSPERVRHTLADMIRFRVLLIAAGYPDANDCDALRHDPAFQMALGRAPESGADLCSQPTMCRLENLPTVTALKRMMAAMVELFCDSFEQVPTRIVLDIDDTEDRVHGRQELALFHAHYGERCFLPIHVYEAITGKPVAMVLRPGKTPAGAEVMLVLRHVIRAIRARWPKVDILVRGDSHYGRHEAMSWCERNRVGYVFGLAGNKVLLRRVATLAEATALERVEGEADKVRRFGEFAYAAETWHAERRVIARVEASDKGADSRFVVTNLAGTPRWLYEAVYCQSARER